MNNKLIMDYTFLTCEILDVKERGASTDLK